MAFLLRTSGIKSAILISKDVGKGGVSGKASCS